MSRVGQTIGGKFELTELMGRSEFGATYRAKTKTGKTVSVKLFHADLDRRLTKRLFSNAKTVSGINHGRVARVLGAKYSQDSDTYLVTQWMPGDTLAALLERRGHLSAKQTADILFQLCSALAPIHKSGLPHGNLKPSNIFMNPGEDATEQVCITDVVGSGVVGRQQNRELIGSAKNMSPDQIKGTECTTSTDFFAIGVLGYRMLAGHYPFSAPTPSQTAEKITNCTYRPIAELKPNEALGLAEIIEKCIQQDDAANFGSLRDVARKLAHYLKSAEAEANTASVELQAESSSSDDPDATMAFQVPDELQAFLDQHDGIFSDESVETTASMSPPNEREDTMDQSIGEVFNDEDIQQPFFTETPEEAFSTVSVNESVPTIDGAPIIAPGQEIDDDLPFNSVSVSQSILDQEASLLDSEDSLVAETEASDSSSPVIDVNDILASSDDSLEAEDIMKALSSTLEAVGPADIVESVKAEAPLAALSDFEELATGEFERRAKDANRFLSTNSQTGLKRPIFTLFLLTLLGVSALLYQFMADENSKQFKAEQAVHRKLRLEQFANMKTTSTEKSAEEDKAQEAQDKPNTDEEKSNKKAETKDERTKPKTRIESPARPKADAQRKSRKTGSKKAKSRKNNRRTGKPTRPQTAPGAVELVNPF